jgi:hypothetical protein
MEARVCFLHLVLFTCLTRYLSDYS